MPTVINGTNALTDILGDSDNEYSLKVVNADSVNIHEPLTGLTFKALETTEFTLKGQMAYEQLLKNIEQINVLKGFEALVLETLSE